MTNQELAHPLSRRAKLWAIGLICAGMALMVATGVGVFLLSANNKRVERQRNAAINLASAEKHVREGIMALYDKRYVDAVAQYDSALMLNHSHAVAYSQRGYCLYLAGHLQDAIADLKQGIALSGNNRQNLTYSHMNLALAFWDEGKQDSAVNEIGAALSLDPGKRAEIWNDVQFRKFKNSAAYLEAMGHPQ